MASRTALRGLPARAVDLSIEQREALATWLRGGWPGEAKKAYQVLSERVSLVSVRRWDSAMERHGGTGEAMLWRLLRMGSAPYFVLGLLGHPLAAPAHRHAVGLAPATTPWAPCP